MPTTTLAAEDLGKSYPDGPALFSGLSLAASKGLVAVAGRNGSGKTTLLKILAGLLSPSAGRVRVERDGRLLTGQGRRLAVGWAGPDLALYGELSALENLAFFRRAGGAPAAEPELGRRLEEVGLAHAAGRRVADYSTGMTQRLRLAFARLFDPPILLLDEPASNLDPEGRDVVRRIIAGARRDGAVVVASSDEGDFEAPDHRIAL